VSCSITSTNPAPICLGGSCPALCYDFGGSFAECAGDSGGNFDMAQCEQLCPPPSPSSMLDAGSLKFCQLFPCNACSHGELLQCTYGPCAPGRRPRGLRPLKAAGARRPAALFLANMAYLEAAASDSFERLARELAAHRAPVRLRRAAVRAARDEVRHARVATALAERAGATVRRPRVPKGRVRSLEAIAVENAVEGCVHETFAAALTLVQAMTAADTRVRAAMRRITPDEMRHAQLAWDVARWLETRLSAGARTRVARARRRAADALVLIAAREVHPQLVSELGLPAAAPARAIALDLAKELWTE
jgi:hypothetical protein